MDYLRHDSNSLLSMKPILILRQTHFLSHFGSSILSGQSFASLFFFIFGVGTYFNYTYFSNFSGTYPGRDYNPCKDAHFYRTNSFTNISKFLCHSSHLITQSPITSHQFTYIKQFIIPSCISN